MDEITLSFKTTCKVVWLFLHELSRLDGSVEKGRRPVKEDEAWHLMDLGSGEGIKVLRSYSVMAAALDMNIQNSIVKAEFYDLIVWQ